MNFLSEKQRQNPPLNGGNCMLWSSSFSASRLFYSGGNPERHTQPELIWNRLPSEGW